MLLVAEAIELLLLCHDVVLLSRHLLCHSARLLSGKLLMYGHMCDQRGLFLFPCPRLVGSSIVGVFSLAEQHHYIVTVWISSHEVDMTDTQVVPRSVTVVTSGIVFWGKVTPVAPIVTLIFSGVLRLQKG